MRGPDALLSLLPLRQDQAGHDSQDAIHGLICTLQSDKKVSDDHAPDQVHV